MSLLKVATAPYNNLISVPIEQPIKHYGYVNSSFYQPLISAIFEYESTNNPLAYNKFENAVGGLQIRQCRIEHYNNLAGTNYKLEDCYNFELSKKIFLFFAKGKSFEQAAKDWNGSGPATEIYWEKVKALIK
jgi:hypothetical protein